MSFDIGSLDLNCTSGIAMANTTSRQFSEMTASKERIMNVMPATRECSSRVESHRMVAYKIPSSKVVRIANNAVHFHQKGEVFIFTVKYPPFSSFLS